ncbi:MAG: hypothetical protein ACR2P6_06920 [Gammaproteobacteria bacterium]
MLGESPAWVCYFPLVQELIEILRRRRLTVIALVLATVAQFAMVTHAVMAEHSLGEHCEICVGQDRSDDALISVGAKIFSVDSSSSVAIPPATVYASSPVSVVRSRGPPVI